MSVVRRDWVEDMAALTMSPGTGWPADAVASATRKVARLTGLARALVDSVLPPACHHPDRCALADVEPGLCNLARALAQVPNARSLPPALPEDPATLVEAFCRALARAGSAIYVCRRVLHPTGECLFGDEPEQGHALCGRTLVAAHHVGDAYG